MTVRDDNFAEYFTLAQVETLTARESRIADLRYGFASGEPHRLEQVGQELGISRERIRQILRRIHRKIYSKGKRQISKGDTAGASACLLLYLESRLRPEEPGNLDRILDFARNELAYLPQQTHALPLLVYLLYGIGERASFQNGWGLLVTDGKRSIQKVQHYGFPVELQTALLSALANSQNGSLSWREYRSIRDQYNATWNDFLAIILKNRLIWNLQPFVLKLKAGVLPIADFHGKA